MTKIYMFPGQGSQTIGMGKDLFDLFPDMMRAADDILGYSIKQLCLEDPDNKLGETSFTQPALFVVNALHYEKKLRDPGARPDIAAGHSLGEYNALYAAGAFDFAAGLRLVQKRGAIMAKAQGGGMAAVIGLEPGAIREALDRASISSIDIANFNSPQQTVISGPADDIPAARTALEKAGARMVIPLKVSGAFHSRYMQGARDEFAPFLDTVAFTDPDFPVIANTSARPYAAGSVRGNLLAQITSSVRWTETIQYCLAQSEPVFEEVGPGKVLEKLIRQIPPAPLTD